MGSVELPLRRAFVASPCGLPVLSPAIVLLYKAKNPDALEARVDFDAAWPGLPAPERRWLVAALPRIDPRHPWLRDPDGIVEDGRERKG